MVVEREKGVPSVGEPRGLYRTVLGLAAEARYETESGHRMCRRSEVGSRLK
jgi:hypothetical protein